MLPGTPITYYGEELGMTDYALQHKAEDSSYMTTERDPCRTPMQWDGTHHAGFSSAQTTWLPVNPDHAQGVNVQDQTDAPRSALSVYRKLAKLRQKGDPHILYGDLEFLPVPDADLLAFKRQHQHNKGYYTVIVNFSSKTFKLKRVLDVKQSDIFLRTCKETYVFGSFQIYCRHSTEVVFLSALVILPPMKPLCW